jgi:LAO/AO transport system kinase
LKKGIVEISDLIVVNKSDGVFASAAREAVSEYTSALKYLHPSSPLWQPRVSKK